MSRMMRLIGAVIAALSLAGCTPVEEWDWFGLKKPEAKSRPMTKSNGAPAATSTDAQAGADPKTGEVDEKVDRYVRSMNATYDPSYENNDFSSKMRRQNDPNRASRIRQTAMRSREGSGDETATPGGAAAKPSGQQGGESAVQAADLAPKAATEPPLNTETPSQVGIASAAEKDDGNESTNSNAASAEGTSKSVRGESTPAEEKKAPPTKPPVLADVKVEAAPEPAKGDPGAPGADTAKKTSTVAANSGAPTVQVVDTFKKRLEEQEARVTRDPNNLEEQFRLRMLYLTDGQDDKALAPSDGIQSDVQEIMQAQIRSMMTARSTAARDPSTWANRQLEAIEALRQAVQSRADLVISKLAFCKKIEGFGDYEPIEKAEYPAGQANQILLYVELRNFTSTRNASGRFRTLLNDRQSLLTQDGKELWSHKDENIEDLSRQKRQDFFLSLGPWSLPKSLAPGDYVVKVEVEDALARKMNSASLPFKITPALAAMER